MKCDNSSEGFMTLGGEWGHLSRGFNIDAETSIEGLLL
jgi:hypothetical protein